MTSLDRQGVLDVVDTMFLFIRESAKLNANESFPSRQIIMDAVLAGLQNIFEYQAHYKVDISNRDSIKIFSFAIPQLNKHIKHLQGNFNMSDATAYMACMDFIATSYQKHVDLNNHPDIRNTCRILSELANSGNELAGYTYFKAMQETAICHK